MKKLAKFFAVTATSLYKVAASGEDHCPYAFKLNLRGNSKIAPGKRISGPMMAVAKHLQFYVPDGHTMLSVATSFERDLEKVNTRWWLGRTSPIVALFLDEAEARKCFDFSGHKPCDPRWRKQTLEVIGAIGDDHPTFTVCHWPDMALLP